VNRILAGIFMTVFCLVWTGCSQIANFSDTREDGESEKGSYTLSDNGLDHTLIFNNNETYNFEHALNASGNRSGSWYAHGNDITMGYEVMGTVYTEVLTASKSGGTVTLEVKEKRISMIRNSFGLSPDTKMILVEK
jgi:hypothetical protein